MSERVWKQTDQLQQEIDELEQESRNQVSSQALCRDEQRPKGVHYSVREIELAVNLARTIGLRPSAKAMKVVFDWLDCDRRVPTYQAIRTWMQRVGLYRMQEAPRVENATWLVDHTMQVGSEKALTIMRVQKSRCLQSNKPLTHRDVELLATIPGSHWTHADVANAYEQVAQTYGFPEAIVCDGAPDLQRPAAILQNAGEKPIVLYDLKHYLANELKKILQADPDYPGFTKQLKHTCASVQQTELAHFVPRAMKRKARFMNIGPILEWAVMALWHLDHPGSEAQGAISDARMLEKLGWLREYRSKIRQWHECQTVIDIGVRLIAKQGISHGISGQFHSLVDEQAHCDLSRKLVENATEFLLSQEKKLKPGDRFPMSTEILESSFALYKELEKQHSKEGFSGLLVGFNTLLRKVTQQEILRAFDSVKVSDVINWVHTHLADSILTKRQTAFREARQTPDQPACTNSATVLLAHT